VFKKLLIAVVALGCLGFAGFGVLARRPDIAPVALPAQGRFAPELITRGEALTGGGYRAACHTAKGGAKFAGGYAMATPFGVIYSTNITPDPETGIGTWSEAAFRRAMQEGVSRDGSHLFPVFSYDHFTRLSDEDVRALYAYFMTRAPVHAPARPNGIPFQHPLSAGGVETAILPAGPLRARCLKECGVEPRRLSRAGLKPLRRLPYVGIGPAAIFFRCCRHRHRLTPIVLSGDGMCAGARRGYRSCSDNFFCLRRSGRRRG
jgi:Cytochrome c